MVWENIALSFNEMTTVFAEISPTLIFPETAILMIPIDLPRKRVTKLVLHSDLLLVRERKL